MLGVPLQIGPVRLESNLMLAPMAGYCDLAWRITCRAFGGVGLACTDLLSPHGLLRGNRESLDLARTNEFDRPIGMQLYGSDPPLMADGARWAADHGATVVDINMGCPVDKVVKKDGGSKLMCDLTKAVAIAEAVRAALPASVPLTCKMRLGWDEAAVGDGCAPELSRRLIDVGAAGITVHGRTTEMRFKGSCRRDGIRRVVDAVGEHTGGTVPVLGNGDVKSAKDAADMMRETGCSGVMVGRGALARPWLFRDAWALQTTGTTPPRPTQVEIAETIRGYFDRMLEYRDEHYALHKVRTRISWLVKPLHAPGRSAKPFQAAVRAARTASEVHGAIDRFLAGELWLFSERGPVSGGVTTGASSGIVIQKRLWGVCP
ncbi:MAG: tRNA-dihydrouridine synthase [Planctomycetota bacterium]